MSYSGNHRTRAINPKSYITQDHGHYKNRFDNNRYSQQYQQHHQNVGYIRNRPQTFNEQPRHRHPPTMDTGNINNRLYMGDLEPQWTEHTIRDIWSKLGEPSVTVRVMHRQQDPSMNQGYCFVEFGTHEAAVAAIAKNGADVPGYPGVKLRLNWAMLSGNRMKQNSSNVGNNANTDNITIVENKVNSNDYSIFVGDLAQDVDETQLFNFFARGFPSTEHAKVMRDPLTGVSRGYGFVKFRHIEDWKRALDDTQRFTLNGRVLKIGPSDASKKLATAINRVKRGNPSSGGGSTAVNNNFSTVVPQSQFMTPAQQRPPMNHFTDCYNTTLFVEGLSAAVAEEDLRQYFEPFGVITHLEIKTKVSHVNTRENTFSAPVISRDEYSLKGRHDKQVFGFVQFLCRRAAETAMEKLQGYTIEGRPMRISWGKLHQIPQPYIDEKVYIPYGDSVTTPGEMNSFRETCSQYMLPGFL